MGSISQNIVSKVSKIRYENLPKEVIDRAKLLLMHHLACACAGRNEEWSKTALQTVLNNGQSGNSTVWFTNAKNCNSFDAAFAVGAMIQSTLQEDVHVDSSAHPGIVVIPCALALGDAMGKSGKDVLEAIVAGYEMMILIGTSGGAEFSAKGFRPTSVLGVLGSSVTAGVLMGFDEEQLASAISMAGNMSCGINEWGKAGTDEMYIQNAFATANGIMAAQLVKNGLKGSATIFEGADNDSGLCRAFGLNKEALWSSVQVERPLGILDVLCKASPSCAMTQTTAQLAKNAAAEGIHVEDLERITVYTPHKAKVYSSCNQAGPYSNSLQARTSQKYVAANILYNGGQYPKTFADYKNEAVTKYSQIITVEEDDEYTRRFPQKLSGRMELELKNGETKVFYQEDASYQSDEDMINGFRSTVSEVFPPERVQELFDAIMNLENLSNVRELTKLLVF